MIWRFLINARSYQKLSIFFSHFPFLFFFHFPFQALEGPPNNKHWHLAGKKKSYAIPVHLDFFSTFLLTNSLGRFIHSLIIGPSFLFYSFLSLPFSIPFLTLFSIYLFLFSPSPYLYGYNRANHTPCGILFVQLHFLPPLGTLVFFPLPLLS